MRKFACIPLVVILLTGLLTGCGGVSKADKHAIAACNLHKGIDEGSDDEWHTESRSLETWDIYDDLVDLEEGAEKWEQRTSEATAASQLDSGFSRLAEAVSTMAAFRYRILNTRKRNPEAETEYQIKSLFLNIDLYGEEGGRHNDSLEVWRAECAGLAARLNT